MWHAPLLHTLLERHTFNHLRHQLYAEWLFYGNIDNRMKKEMFASLLR